MTEQFDGLDNSKSFTAEEFQKMRELADKVWEVIGWDLGKMCGTNDEIDFVDKAQDGMKEIAAILDMPSKTHKPIISVGSPKTFSLEKLLKIRASLSTIEEVLGWDISASDVEEMDMIKDARESLKTLKNIV